MVVTPLKNGGLKCQVSDLALLIDPPASARGDITLATSASLPLTPSSDETINTAGEYEISGIRIRGVQIKEESSKKEIRTAYVADVDGMSLCFLGNLSTPLPSETMDRLGGIDVLFLSVGEPGLEEKKAAALIKEMEPKVVIFTACRDRKALAAALGTNPEEAEKFTAKRKDLSEDGLRVLILQSA